ncbi:hypothetical protein SBOR_4388 [Sclerotinia borealis F-4128]|uniref:Rhodopsin domain-containing protein n=1 Tax=Sclerotinia borealis (strain F-4128) TaxID=1432307 RepID=W9CGZ7_SCLBF|nr:hypothetical protein SBOR_4388 [Sclerotinia borealis F-4128]
MQLDQRAYGPGPGPGPGPAKKTRSGTHINSVNDLTPPSTIEPNIRAYEQADLQQDGYDNVRRPWPTPECRHLLSVAQCLCTSEQVAHGLGQNQDSILPSELNRFYIAQYVGHIMYILAIFVSKLSSLYFFICLTGEGSTKRRVIKGCIVCIGTWSFISIIVVALQCHFPEPWNFHADRCIDVRAFWAVNSVVDILTQICVVLLPIYILNGLKMEECKKRVTILLFSPNLLTLPLVILRMIYFYRAIYSTNYTWDSFSLALTTNLHSSFAIILSCIPFSKSIIDSLVLTPPHIVTDTTRGTVSSSRSNSPGRGNKYNTGGSSNFLSGVAGRTTTIVTITRGGKAHELNEYLNRAESQERMIPEPKSPASSKAE